MKKRLIPGLILVFAFMLSIFIGMYGMVLIKKNMFESFNKKLDNDIKNLHNSLKEIGSAQGLDFEHTEPTVDSIIRMLDKIEDDDLPESINKKVIRYNYEVEAYQMLKNSFLNRLLSRFINASERKTIE